MEKNITIEDKAKAYDEAVKEASIAYKDEDRHLKAVLERIFPELAESKDEKIRKELLHLISYIDITEENRKKWIAWLEKQKEAQFGDEDRYMDGYMNGMNDALKGQKPVDRVEPKFRVGDKIKLAKEPKYPAREIIAIKDDAYYFDKFVHLPFSHQDEWELVEQKSAWSEEDERNLQGIIDEIEVNKHSAPDYDLATYDRFLSWLKSLKDRVFLQPKQEWSDEDYNEIETIACHLDNIGNECMAEVLRNIRDKYYHIIPQDAWKPSEHEQN